MRYQRIQGPAVMLWALAMTGCAGEPAAPLAAPGGAKYLLAAAPDGAQPVAEARSSARDQEPVVVVGRIGGDAHPWVDGVAAFSIVDPALQPCNAKEGDDCPTPWDYCCDLDVLASSKALVKIVDEQGQLVPVDARQLLSVKELQTVVVRGSARRDEAGNLTVMAAGVYCGP